MTANVLIIESRFYDDISDMLLVGAKEALDKEKASYDVITVPGAFEVPAALNFAIKGQKKYDVYIALGCVIRGETSHYDLVCEESARGLYDLTLRHDLALGNGIITVENRGQAEARADKSSKNKGGGAAQAALAMLALKKKLAA